MDYNLFLKYNLMMSAISAVAVYKTNKPYFSLCKLKQNN